jgi:hypothetical protein
LIAWQLGRLPMKILSDSTECSKGKQPLIYPGLEEAPFFADLSLKQAVKAGDAYGSASVRSP